VCTLIRRGGQIAVRKGNQRMSTDGQGHPASHRAHAAIVLVGFMAACFLVAGVSSIFSVAAIPGWYAALNKPSFNPPNGIFGPVWTLLYALMAIAAWLVWKQPAGALRSSALRIFWLQLFLNFSWSWIFFHEHRLGASLLEIFVLWLAIVAATVLFLRVARLAAWLMLPYVAWVAFAALLNFAIWRLNPA
jgi:translocator protein